MQKHEDVLHEVPLMIIGQDAGDIPVSGGQGLKYVCARVRLEKNVTFNTTTKDFNKILIQDISEVVYHRRGHGDVEKLSSPTLRDCSGEEKLVPVLGEERWFILQWKRNICMFMPSGPKCARRARWCLVIYLFKVRIVQQTPSVHFFFVLQQQWSSVFITYLSVQPALTLIFMFLKIMSTWFKVLVNFILRCFAFMILLRNHPKTPKTTVCQSVSKYNAALVFVSIM